MSQQKSPTEFGRLVALVRFRETKRSTGFDRFHYNY